VLLILMLFQHQRQLLLEQGPAPQEADFRLPIDSLVSYIFRTLELSEGNAMGQMCEYPLILPVSELELGRAIADLAVCIEMRDFSVDLPDHVRDEITAIDLRADLVYTDLHTG